jgi:hypothetical protein
MTNATPILIGIGLLLSACAVEPDYGAPDYAYTDPVYGSLDFDYGGWGGWGGWHHGWDHGNFDHGHGFHGGIGHGFGHAGFSGHAGGHGGGGHR